MLGEDLDDAARRCELVVARADLGIPLTIGDVEDVAEPVGRGLVGAEDAEVVRVPADDVGEEPPEHAHRLARLRRRPLDRHGICAKVRQVEIAQAQPAVRIRVGAHPTFAVGCQRTQLRPERAALVEQLLGVVAPQPLLEQGAVLVVVARVRQRHLMRAPGVLHLKAVDLARPRPALRRAQDDHRPARPSGTGFCLIPSIWSSASSSAAARSR